MATKTEIEERICIMQSWLKGDPVLCRARGNINWFVLPFDEDPTFDFNECVYKIASMVYKVKFNNRESLFTTDRNEAIQASKENFAVMSAYQELEV